MWGWALASAARGATVCVGAPPDCLDSLQAALDDPANHTVEIYGIHPGPFRVDREVTLVGMDNARLRLPIGANDGPLLRAVASITIRDLTLEANHSGQNLDVEGGVVVLDEVVLSRGTALPWEEGCARIVADELTVTGGSMVECRHFGLAAGLSVEAGVVNVEGMALEGNDGPALQIVGASSATLDGLVVAGNGSEQRGRVGGVQLIDVAALAVTRSWFCDNVGRRGGALRIQGGCDPGDCTVEHAVFRDNHAQIGAGIAWGGAQGGVRHSTFVDNSARFAGSAVMVGLGHLEVDASLFVEGSPAASAVDPPTLGVSPVATLGLTDSALSVPAVGVPLGENLALDVRPAFFDGWVPAACGSPVTLDPTVPANAPFAAWPDEATIGALTTADCGAWCQDTDADSVPAMWDCDDGDPARGLGLEELGDDGVDQDCDGLDVCFQDPDGDGYGSDPVPIEVGAECAGAVSQGNDCDEGDPAIHPGALELAGDARDQDCDGAELCYADADADGFTGGTLVPGDLTCATAGVGAMDQGDCDDADPRLTGPYCSVRVVGGCDHGNPVGWLAGLGLILTRRRRGCATGRR